MGSYLNPGYSRFLRAITGTRYIDKTMMIAKTNEWMNSSKSLICMSRPRRFGKTMAATMLSAYYSKGYDSEPVFKNMKISSACSFQEHLNKEDVIYIDIGGEYSVSRKRNSFIENINNKVLTEMKDAFPDVIFNDEDSIGEAIRKVYSSNGAKFIIIFDEYDALVRENVDKKLLDDYLLFLNGLFKNETVLDAISLAYLTGILPIVKDKIQSKLNNFDPQYTFLDAEDLTQYMGFTRDEVAEICGEAGLDFPECQRWYNGYSQHGFELYNPKSIIRLAEKKKFANYWSQSASFQVITERLNNNFEGMREDVISMLGGGEVKIDANSYLNTMNDFAVKDEVFTYLIHLGYLAYDNNKNCCRIPNLEIRQEWIRAIRQSKHYTVTSKIISESEKLLYDTLSLNEDAVSNALDISHIHATTNRSYNNEDGLQCAIYLSYIYALNEYTVFREASAGKGIADMVYLPVPANSDKPALIIELKRNRSVDGALKQISNKQYFASLEHFQGNILFIGISYDEKSKSHSCKIEKFEK